MIQILPRRVDSMSALSLPILRLHHLPLLLPMSATVLANKTTLGITGGTTGALALYGIKFNTLIAGSENKRLLFRFLSVYYPERDGRFMFDRKDKYVMPWFLTMAVIDGEWKLKNRMRLNAGDRLDGKSLPG